MRYALLLALLCLIGMAPAQNFDKARLDQYLNTLEAHDKAMFSLSLLKNGESVYQKSIGYLSTEDSQKPNAETQYRIGSITKVFTTVMIFQLIEEGKLALDTKLSAYYPKVTNADRITISQLLSHRSGIHNFTNDALYRSYMTEPKTKLEMVTLIEGLGSDFEPDSRADYSNSAFVLLGYIIEDITGDNYASQLSKRIVTPLSLKRTAYGSAIDPSKNQAKSYNHRFGGWTPATITDMSIPHAAGAIISTSTEVGQFFTALFSGKLISDGSLSKMKEINQGFGRGLFRMPFFNRIGYGHTGGIDGFSANAGYFEADGLAIVVTSNGMNYNMNDIMIGTLSIYFGRDFSIPDFEAKSVALSAKALRKYEGTFASSEIPLKFVLKVDGDKLTAQATGQSAFPLTPFSSTEFRFEQAGIVITFGKDGKKVDYSNFSIKQGASTITFIKE